MNGSHYYGSAQLRARMSDGAGNTYDIVETTYTFDVWEHMKNHGGTRLYQMYADMSLAEVIATLAECFGMVEIVEGEVI